MLQTLFLFGFLLGLDSLIVGVSIGPLFSERRRRLQLACSFAVFDGLGCLLGSMTVLQSFRSRLPGSEWLAPMVLAGYGIYVLYLTSRCKEMPGISKSSIWFSFGLPICLSFDNLVAGTVTNASPLQAVWAASSMGAISGLMALIGMEIGLATVKRFRLGAGWTCGVALITAACGLAVGDLFQF
jgi:putative Mn2+ efflux pump MntP